MLAPCKHGYYPEAMSPNVLIRNVPDDVHAVLIRRAEDAGQSLQEYLVGLLRDVTARPLMPEVIAALERDFERNPRPPLSPDEIQAMLRADRDERERLS
jgi:antitoxin FitA